MNELVILGAGTAGTMMLNKLTRALDSSEWRLTIVDNDETHYYQPGFLFIPFGIYEAEDYENILHYANGEELEPTFDGHANCFIETGFGKATQIDFNYDTEPRPGKYPLPALGPMSLLKETRLTCCSPVGSFPARTR